MISYEEALDRALELAHPLPAEWIALDEALGRYLSRDVLAREPIPRFDQSSMDGYGVRAADLQGASEARPVSLRVMGEVRAGEDAGPRSLAPGEVVRIFTGAPIPCGVDAVVMQEICERHGERVVFRKEASAGGNIRRRGEEFQQGARVLTAGTRVTPPVVGLLATLGCERVEVHKKPRVALITTGNELVSVGEEMEPGQIYDANSIALEAALAGMGIDPVVSLRVSDCREVIRIALNSALAAADVVLTVGGVSVGDYDYVKDVAAECGVEPVYWQVAIKPGMPNYLGVWRKMMGMGKGAEEEQRDGSRLLFGLPGNPVAALVSFYLFVRPALLRMMGSPEGRPRYMRAALTGELKKRHSRLEWVRGVLAAGEAEGLTVAPTSGQESHMLGGLAAANCLIEFPAEREMLERGEAVRVMMLDWEGV